MIKGIGVDIVEIERIRRIYNLQSFVNRILHEEEINIYNTFESENRQLQFLAGRFSAKEAYSKALGTGIGPIRFNEIIILNDELGKPYIKNNEQALISISHSDEYAVSMVVIQ